MIAILLSILLCVPAPRVFLPSPVVSMPAVGNTQALVSAALSFRKPFKSGITQHLFQMMAAGAESILWMSVGSYGIGGGFRRLHVWKRHTPLPLVHMEPSLLDNHKRIIRPLLQNSGIAKRYTIHLGEQTTLEYVRNGHLIITLHATSSDEALDELQRIISRLTDAPHWPERRPRSIPMGLTKPQLTKRLFNLKGVKGPEPWDAIALDVERLVLQLRIPNDTVQKIRLSHETDNDRPSTRWDGEMWETYVREVVSIMNFQIAPCGWYVSVRTKRLDVSRVRGWEIFEYNSEPVLFVDLQSPSSDAFNLNSVGETMGTTVRFTHDHIAHIIEMQIRAFRLFSEKGPIVPVAKRLLSVPREAFIPIIARAALREEAVHIRDEFRWRGGRKAMMTREEIVDVIFHDMPLKSPMTLVAHALKTLSVPEPAQVDWVVTLATEAHAKARHIFLAPTPLYQQFMLFQLVMGLDPKWPSTYNGASKAVLDAFATEIHFLKGGRIESAEKRLDALFAMDPQELWDLTNQRWMQQAC